MIIKGRWFIFGCYLVLSACVFVRAPNSEEMALLDNPPSEVRDKQNLITPLALQWISETERYLLSKGRALSETETSMARAVGIKHPDRVRVVILVDFPSPANETLRIQAEKYGLGNEAEGGRTMGYAIMLKEKYAQERWIIAHELVHVAQQEKMGRDKFVRRFIVEYELMGHRRAPLELEANKIALDFM